MLAYLVKYFKSLDETAATPRQQEEKVLLATCVLLLEIAKSDDDFSTEEHAAIHRILVQELSIASEKVEELLQMAARDRRRSVDIWEYTSLINDHFSRSEKISLVERMWKVIFADGKVDQYEDYMVHKLADLLRLTHDELIHAKLEAKPATYTGR